jgi:cytochrome oxidase Cu insertion factor (SCO1/SenC/PrrC family)
MDTNKLKLTFLLLVAAVPISLATWVYGVREVEGVSSTTNKGELVVPVIDITRLDLRDEQGQPAYVAFEERVSDVDPKDYEPKPWQLLYLGTAECETQCEERLYFLRQMHKRLNGEASRIERVYVHVADTLVPLPEVTRILLTEQQGDMKIVYATSRALQATLAPTVPDNIDPINLHYIYVVDPLGNVMMYFTPENTPEEMLDDLDKLLDRSSVG